MDGDYTYHAEHWVQCLDWQITMVYTWNKYDIICQLYFDNKIKFKKNNITEMKLMALLSWSFKIYLGHSYITGTLTVGEASWHVMNGLIERPMC